MNIYQYYKNNPRRSLVYGASGIAASFLIVALIGQYGFDLHPCELCIAQRVPYGIIAMLGLISGMKLGTDKKLEMVAIICIGLFFVDAGIAAYHSAVEMGIVKGPSACTNNDRPGQTLEEMRAAIMHAQLVPCDQPMAYFLGLSMASWNGIAATITGIAMMMLWMRVRKSGGAG
jgi:disulfide bond formation protein DsbB